MSRIFGLSAAGGLVLGLAGLAGLALAQPAAEAAKGDPAKGEAIFTDQCSACHEAKEDLQGPRLGGLIGRKAGSVPGFGYTDALKNSGLTWTPATLDQFLADPGKMVPGTSMPASIPDPAQRRDLVAYLVKLSASGQ